MQTIGERLAEARKRRGISIREASESTKIRSEYLANFENNSFDINLPEIYVRGFLRSYGNFLKLNPDKLITDFNAHRLGETKISRRDGGREILGRMDVPEKELPSSDGSELPASPSAPRREQMPASPSRFDDSQGDWTQLLKLGTVIGGAVVLVALIVFLVLTIMRSESSPAAEETAPAVPAATVSTLVIRAEGGDIAAVSVTDSVTNQLLYRGPLSQGEQRSFETANRVRIACTDTQHLLLDLDGNRSRPRGSGPGQFLFP